MKIDKKVWVKPELGILSRGQPGEVVLGLCKNVEIGTSGPGGGVRCKETGGQWCQVSGES